MILVDQIAGVEDATPESVKAMSAVGRSGQNEHHAPCLSYVSKWPEAEELNLRISCSKLGAKQKRYALPELFSV